MAVEAGTTEGSTDLTAHNGFTHVSAGVAGPAGASWPLH